MKLTVAAIQFDPQIGSVEKNMDLAEEMIAEALVNGARLIVLPELFNTGYRLDEEYAHYAEKIPGPSVERITAYAKLEQVYMAGCIVEKDQQSGMIYDTAFLTGPNGLVGTYRKTHLWGAEGQYFSTGPAFPVFDTPIGKIGMLICYDIGFPEAARCLALAGAELILVPSAFGKPRSYAWELATRARALENGCFLVAANRIGKEKDSEFCGHSRVVDPQGMVIKDGGLEEVVIVTDLDPQDIERQRGRIPYFRDRRPDLYQLICEKRHLS